MMPVETENPSLLEIALRNRVKAAFLAEARVNDREKGFISVPSTNQLRNPEIQECVAKIIAFVFEEEKIDKVLGIPISGIPLSTAVAAQIPGVREVPTRKGLEVPPTWEKVFSVEPRSFTTEVQASIKYAFVYPGDRVLLIDDVCAYGVTGRKIVNSLINEAGAEVVGLAVWWDKEFQGGLRRISEKLKIRTFSAVTVKNIGPNNEIVLKEV